MAAPASSSNVPQDDEQGERETNSASTDDECPPEKAPSPVKKFARRTSFSATAAPAWNRKRGRNGSEARLAGPDGRVGGGHKPKDGTEFFLTLMSESIDGSKAFVAGSVLSLVAWSVLCALFSGWLAELANDDVRWAESWLEDMQACNSAIGVLGEGRRKAADMEETLACASNTLICRLVATPRYLRNVVRVYLGFQVQSGEDTT